MAEETPKRKFHSLSIADLMAMREFTFENSKMIAPHFPEALHNGLSLQNHYQIQSELNKELHHRQTDIAKFLQIEPSPITT